MDDTLLENNLFPPPNFRKAEFFFKRCLISYPIKQYAPALLVTFLRINMWGFFFVYLENQIISCVQNNKIKKSRDNRVGLQPGSKKTVRVREEEKKVRKRKYTGNVLVRKSTSVNI